ncbi:MAG: macro domain-containing protein [Syntrophomonas sp.]
MEWIVNGIVLQIIQGDITRQDDLEAIVNAANSSLRGGGGVDGAIHRAAGPELKKESCALAPLRTGGAVATGAYQLPQRFIIHCVGPVYGRDKPEERLLSDCYRNALALAEEKQIRSIGFPAISTGIYGYPLKDAAQVMLSTILKCLPGLKSLQLIRAVLFDQAACKVHCTVLEELLPKR